MSPLTVITHIYNEEYLLPFWLKHHKRLFDRGIIVDYHSTDKSREIIKEICPTWEIIPSKNQYYSRPTLYPELIEIEKRIKGWKTILNVTEFIFHPDLRTYLHSLCPNVKGVWMPPVSLIDDNPQNPLNDDMPLVLQKSYGTIGYNEIRPTNRLIHKHIHGEWRGEGGHDSYMTNTFIASDLFHVWLGWCPWRPEFIKRKLQIQDKMTKEYKGDKAKEEVGYHVTNEEELRKRFGKIYDEHCKCLFNNGVYAYLYREIEKSYTDSDYKFSPFLIDGEVEYNAQKIVSQLRSMQLNYLIMAQDKKRGANIFSVDIDNREPVASISCLLQTMAKWFKYKLAPLSLRMIIDDTRRKIRIVDSENITN